MNDTAKFAERMAKIGKFKERELKLWRRKSTLRQRIRIAEQLLLSLQYMHFTEKEPAGFCSLSKLLEGKIAGTK
ncbi:MAG: hypothetical protein HZA48_08265 [Planctomycetes bacterium]|nr:hypothetical protein [Planctomycetota bacterium]